MTRDDVEAGDVLIGLRSTGLHTNGYSLARKVFEGVSLTASYFEPGHSLADDLLQPHKSYLKDMQSVAWKGAAHITGGGIPGNLPRCLPPEVGAHVYKAAWEPNPIFREIQKRGRITDDEMWGTFNMGLGMILVVDPKDVPQGALVVGEIVKQDGPDRVTFR